VALEPAVTANPLWPLVLILARIAERVDREQATEGDDELVVGIRMTDATWLKDDRHESNQGAGEPEEAA
jgi:hypothetical protein